MLDPLQDITSGDIITSSWFNQVLAELRSLRATVQLLQQSSSAGSALQISGFDRTSVLVNEFVTIVGRNFAFPWTGNTVTFDGAPAQITRGTSVELRVRVPDPGNLGVGRLVTVEVAMTGTSQRASMQLFVGPAASATPVPTFSPIQNTLSFSNSGV